MKLGFFTYAAAVALLYVTPVKAETLNYYFVGAAPKFSNISNPINRSALNLGVLRVDTSKIPVGQDRDNFRLLYEEDFDDEQEFAPDYLAYSIVDVAGCCFNDSFSYIDIEVNNGKIRKWNVATNSNGGIVNGLYSSSTDGDTILGFFPGAGDGNEVELVYSTERPGEWFSESDFGAYSLAILNNSREAALNPPKSDHDVAPIPVPAPLALLGSSIILLVSLRRKSIIRM